MLTAEILMVVILLTQMPAQIIVPIKSGRHQSLHTIARIETPNALPLHSTAKKLYRGHPKAYTPAVRRIVL